MGAVERNEYMRGWRDKRREELRQYQREYMRARRAADPEKARTEGRERAKRLREDAPELVRQRERAWYHSLSPEEKKERAAKQRVGARESIRAAAKRWGKNNPGKKNAETAKRRAAQRRAMPPWVDRSAIRQVYIECARVSRETGVKHHVDHIHPLQHPLFCGLHVPWNLQILPALENQRKSNRGPS